MQAVYTDVQVSNVATNGVYLIDAVNVLEAVKNLNEGDAHAEEQHRHEAAVGLVQMQEAKGRKSKLDKISGPQPMKRNKSVTRFQKSGPPLLFDRTRQDRQEHHEYNQEACQSDCNC